ncbi:MAG: hypothetical protein ACRCZQ_02310, partial [Bacteroidales bacterium]
MKILILLLFLSFQFQQNKLIAGDSNLFQTFSQRVIKDVRADKGMHPDSLDKSVEAFLSLLNNEGAYSDVDYTTNVRTNWVPLKHLDRMILSALAYTNNQSRYYESEQLKQQIDAMLSYWHQAQPRSRNWYQNEIGEP